MAFIKKLLSSSIKKLIFSMIFITLGDWWRLEIFMMDVDSSAKKPDENQPDENQPDENQPDHDMPDVGDNAEAPDGGDNPPAPHGENNPPAPHGPNIQPIGPEHQRRQFHPRSKILMDIHKVPPIFTILNLLKGIKNLLKGIKNLLKGIKIKIGANP